MYAGKTTETLKRILWARNGESREVYVFKPTFDTRYGESEIVSHDGLRAKALNIAEIPSTEFKAGDLVFLDEIQFYMEPYFSGDVVAWVKTLLAGDVEVVAAGLDMDWQGNPFEITARLLAMANDAKKLTAHCTVCGKPATKTFKKQQDPDSGSVELGATELYEARCNSHWNFPNA
ncbi:Thymidine kinase [compost metagenome]